MKRIYLPLLVISIVFASCSREKSRTLSVLNTNFAFEIGIYFSGDSVKVEDVRKAIARLLPGFKNIVDPRDTAALRRDGYVFRKFESIPQQYSVPDTSYLMYASVGLTQEEQLKLSKLTSGLVLTFFGTNERVVDKQRNIATLVAELTENKDVFIADFMAINFFNPVSWSEKRVANFVGKSINDQVIMHAYREEQFCRIITLGMGKFCLPDISIKDAACSNQEDYSELVNAVIATLIDDPHINTDSTLSIDLDNLSDPDLKRIWASPGSQSGKRKTDIKVRFVEPEDGDNPNTQLRLVFEDPAFTSPQEQQNQILADLFGTVDNLTQADHNDELLAASNRAKQRLPELRELFNQNVQPAISIMLKAPFATDDGGNEWMWIEVTKWNGSDIEGILQNEPYNVKGLKSGAVVSAKEEDIFDYILYRGDGSVEGNETGKVIESQQNK